MLPKYHITLGAIVSLIIYLFFPITIFQAIVIFLSSFLIDCDHYLYYFLKTKDFSFKKAVKYNIKNRERQISLPFDKKNYYKRPILIFHGIEF